LAFVEIYWKEEAVFIYPLAFLYKNDAPVCEPDVNILFLLFFK